MRSVLHIINGSIAVLLYFLNTVAWFLPIMLFSLLKLLPIKLMRLLMSIAVDRCATYWISFNNLNQKVFSRTHIDANLPNDLNLDDWYLIIANHQSWVDILVLQNVFNKKIPFLKFFLKQSLIYVPFLGLAWWGLDFPFMKRYSKSFLQKNPHLKGADLKATKQACKKFEYTPVSIMNFVEGTRYHTSKAKSEFTTKLGLTQTMAPKAGGVAFVLDAMGNKLNKLLDVTIHYPNGAPTYWDFICGKVKRINVKVNCIQISELYDTGIYSSEYFDSVEQKQTFQDWLNKLWQAKDQQLNKLERESDTNEKN